MRQYRDRLFDYKIIEEQISRRTWSEVERWLLEANQQVGNLGKRM
ncbi:MAG: DUF5357 family protein, partial [Snowella sp.]